MELKMEKLPGIPKSLHVTSWFCFNVRTGSLILGWFGVLFSIASILGASAFLNLVEYLNPNAIKILNPEIYSGANSLIFCGWLGVLMNGAMIAGVLQNRPELMYPWIYYQFITFVTRIIINIIVLFIFFVLLMVSDLMIINEPLPFKIKISFFIALLCVVMMISFIVYAIEIYCYAPVIVHCRKIIDMKNTGKSSHEESNQVYIQM